MRGIHFRVPQVSMLVLFHYNILIDLFLVVKDIYFVSDSDNVDDAVLLLQESSTKLFKWITKNKVIQVSVT